MSVRYEWFQTDEKVVVSVLIKKADEKNCSVEIQPDRLVLSGDEGCNVTLDLFTNINNIESGFKISSVKIEITLKKLCGVRWPSLIKTEEINVVTPTMATITSETTADSKTPRNHTHWDKVVKDIWTKEDLEKDEYGGDNGFFKKLMEGCSAEQQKAMIKSFTESGGTCLNTNWEEVRQGKVEVNPPEGTEYRKWDS